ncbi:Cytidine deaminase [Aquisphaera giovannonii]|uniref:Cytidine deaminase n=1 Tax=Aquisphaera giovannonii TaxID=406548 RepID=A0A5B9VWF2_9BACT|nr:cytidine deaminase [Aquisphaera giovannonii]QEH32786.1 Cytidine deaminase [Aquisphaera giovannonii]
MIANADRAALRQAAREAAARAHAPYSRFRVGAAVLTDRGTVHAGCNVENASYGLTICAERNAIFRAVCQADEGPLRIRAVLVYTPTEAPTAPCGACRQVLNEFGPQALVICECDGPDAIETSVDRLLPSAFGPHNLDASSASPGKGP